MVLMMTGPVGVSILVQSGKVNLVSSEKYIRMFFSDKEDESLGQTATQALEGRVMFSPPKDVRGDQGVCVFPLYLIK